MNDTTVKGLAELQKAAGESIGSAVTVSRTQDQGVPRPLLEAVLRAVTVLYDEARFDLDGDREAMALILQERGCG